MSLEEWLQSGKWATAPDLSGAAGRALEGLGGLLDRSQRRARKAAEKGREQLQEAGEKLATGARVEALKERAAEVREKTSAAAEKALRLVKERPAARLARAGVQVKAGLTGFGAGYLLPDAEVLFLGAGGWGRWLTQSGVPVWGAERLARMLLSRPPDARADGRTSEKWALRKELHGTVAMPLLTGMSAGLGLRLIQDAVNVRDLPGAARIILGDRTLFWERAWMLGNGVWCLAMGKDLLLVTLGRSERSSLSQVLKRLSEESETVEEAKAE